MAGKSALVKALNLAVKKTPAVHELPRPKEPKGMEAVSPQTGYYPPTIYLDTKDFPGIKDWKVGDTVNLAVQAKVRGKNISQVGSKDERHSCDLEIVAISDLGTGKKGG